MYNSFGDLFWSLVGSRRAARGGYSCETRLLVSHPLEIRAIIAVRIWDIQSRYIKRMGLTRPYGMISIISRKDDLLSHLFVLLKKNM